MPWGKTTQKTKNGGYESLPESSDNSIARVLSGLAGLFRSSKTSDANTPGPNGGSSYQHNGKP